MWQEVHWLSSEKKNLIFLVYAFSDLTHWRWWNCAVRTRLWGMKVVIFCLVQVSCKEQMLWKSRCHSILKLFRTEQYFQVSEESRLLSFLLGDHYTLSSYSNGFSFLHLILGEPKSFPSFLFPFYLVSCELHWCFYLFSAAHRFCFLCNFIVGELL